MKEKEKDEEEKEEEEKEEKEEVEEENGEEEEERYYQAFGFILEIKCLILLFSRLCVMTLQCS